MTTDARRRKKDLPPEAADFIREADNEFKWTGDWAWFTIPSPDGKTKVSLQIHRFEDVLEVTLYPLDREDDGEELQCFQQEWSEVDQPLDKDESEATTTTIAITALQALALLATGKTMSDLNLRYRGWTVAGLAKLDDDPCAVVTYITGWNEVAPTPILPDNPNLSVVLPIGSSYPADLRTAHKAWQAGNTNITLDGNRVISMIPTTTGCLVDATNEPGTIDFWADPEHPNMFTELRFQITVTKE